MKFKLLLFICCGISCCGLQAQPGAKADTWLQHTDTTYNFTMMRPASWEFKLPGTNTRFFVTSYKENDADAFRENLNCIVRTMENRDFVISSAEDAIKRSVEKLDNYKLLQSGYVKWNNADALQLSYTCTQESGGIKYNIHLFQQIAVVKGLLFTITFTAETSSYDKYIVVASKVIQSLKVN